MNVSITETREHSVSRAARADRAAVASEAPGARSSRGAPAPTDVRVFQVIETFIGDANQLISLFSVLGENRDAGIHAYSDGKLQRL